MFAAACLMACACQEKQAGGQEGFYNPDGNQEISITPDMNTVLHNPMNGWVLYISADSDPSYFDKEIYVSALGKNVRIRDYASACYMRTEWKKMNPEDGVYFWQDPDNNISKLVAKAEEVGLPIAFRVIVDGRDRNGADGATPLFVRDRYGAEVWDSYATTDDEGNVTSSHPNWFTPLVTDPKFRECYERFIVAFAKEFNDPDRVAFIDGYGLGKWGEGHNVCYEQNNASSDKIEDEKQETMEWITKLYSGNFTKVPLVINYHRHIATPQSEGHDPSPNSEKLLNIAISNGYCLRSDAFGMRNQSWGYTDWEKAFARSWNYKVPIIMEGGYIVSSAGHQSGMKGDGYNSPADVRQGEYDDSKEAKVNMMDFRVGSETESWFNDAFNLVKKFTVEGGYRLYPDKVSLPADIASGSSATIVHRWRNVGWGYFPNNLKQWDYKYKVAFALLDGDGNVARLFVDSSCEPSEWTSTSGYSYSFDVTADVPAGDYTWAVGIVNTGKDNVPEIQLAVSPERKTADGWVTLASVHVK